MHCDHDGCELHPASDNKHTVVVVDKNEAHRKQVVGSLLSFYNAVEFDNAVDALAYMEKLPQPGCVLVDEDIPGRGGFEMVRQLRQSPKTKDLATIVFLASDRADKLAAVRQCGAGGWLVKPFLRSTLIKKISDLLNSNIEQQWEALPEIQSRALKGTVSIFNSIADTIASGEPIVYKDVSDACTPLIEAVNSNNFMGILNGVKNHDNYTYVHSLRVATMLTLFGHAINLPPHEQKILATGGLLHDVGKMSIPHAVLNKPGRLTDDEFEVMKGHVGETIRCLQRDETIPKGIVTIAGQHHEKLDGSGYPFGLEGSKLNELARMAAIVDIFSALTDRRVYKPAMTAEEALAIMTDQMSRHLDIPLLGMFRQRFLDALSTF